MIEGGGGRGGGGGYYLLIRIRHYKCIGSFRGSPTEMFSSSMARLPRGAIAIAFFKVASYKQNNGF